MERNVMAWFMFALTKAGFLIWKTKKPGNAAANRHFRALQRGWIIVSQIENILAELLSYCATAPSLLRISGPTIIAITILIKSAGINGMTHTARAADTV